MSPWSSCVRLQIWAIRGTDVYGLNEADISFTAFASDHGLSNVQRLCTTGLQIDFA